VVAGTFGSGAFTFPSTLAVTGVLTVNATGTHNFTGGTNGSQIVQSENTTSGTSASAIVRAKNAAGLIADLRIFSAGYSTSTWDAASTAALQTNATGGLNIVANDASGVVKVYTGGTTERLRIGTSGNVGIASGKKLYFDGVDESGNAYIYSSSSQLVFNINTAAFTMQSTNFVPNTDNAQTLGASANRWSAVWAANGTIQTSDREAKREIGNSSLGLAFVERLVSRRYLMRDEGDTHHRHGFVTDEVLSALNGESCCGFVVGEPGKSGINYAAFVPPLVRAVQELAARIRVLEAGA
jgi:hypothetical protein